jgi:hypothetical protein
MFPIHISPEKTEGVKVVLQEVPDLETNATFDLAGAANAPAKSKNEIAPILKTIDC